MLASNHYSAILNAKTSAFSVSAILGIKDNLSKQSLAELEVELK